MLRLSRLSHNHSYYCRNLYELLSIYNVINRVSRKKVVSNFCNNFVTDFENPFTVRNSNELSTK